MDPLIVRLEHWVKLQPDKSLFNFLSDEGVEQDSMTYAEVDAKTRALAAHLLDVCEPGDRVLLVFEPSLLYIMSFLACVRAGVIAVPVFPPDPRKLKKDMYMFVTIVENCGAAVALTSTSYNAYKRMADLKNMFSNDAKWPELEWVIVDELPSVTGATAATATTAVPSAASNPTDVAFLQYTSGSTSEPKGVMISHENLAHNLTMIIHELKADQDTVCVSWLPQYHDMGLIGSYLGTLYCGGTGFYMSPFAFLKNPLIWLQTVSKYRGTHLQAPSFAYALAARKYAALKRPLSPALELSSIQHMINAAEPVDAQALEKFYATFGPFGLARGVVYPTYGLAEHTVFVCSGGTQVLRVDKEALEGESAVRVCTGAEAPSETVMVGCGFPARERPAGVEPVEVAIVSVGDDGGSAASSSTPLGEDKVGEIWVRSASKAQGYWGMPDKSADDFGATLIGGSTTFLRTGDLGFLHGGELFICGRLKDLIILRGRNHYPQDIERCVEGASSLFRAGRSAAFAVSSGNEEQIAVVVELKAKQNRATCQSLVADIRASLSKEQGVQIGVCYLCKDHTVPITTSGKIARSWCKRNYDAGTFETIYEWQDDASGAAEEAKNGGSDGELADDDEAGVDQEPVSQADIDLLLQLPDEELLAKLIEDTADVVALPAESLREQTGVALVTLGLDSLGLAQMKQMLELQYGCPVPDDWMYFDTTTLEEVLVAVRMGGVTEEQAADGRPLEIQVDPDGGNKLLQTCPCLLMCCPKLVLG